MTIRTKDGERALKLGTGVAVAWLLISVHPFWRYFPHSTALLASAVGFVGIVAAVWYSCLLGSSARPAQVKMYWFVLLYLGLVGVFLVFYPISLRQTLTMGSDREDALRIAIAAIQHHAYPYSYRTYLGNPITPLPGALLLAFPFAAIGHIAWQNLFWLPLFFGFVLSYFRFRSTALLFLAVFLFLAPGDLRDCTCGGDYIINFCYISIATALFLHCLRRPMYMAILAAIFLGITLSSRNVYILLCIPLLALSLQRAPAGRVAILFAVLAASTAAVTLPVFMPHPIGRLLAQVGSESDKLQHLPRALHASVTLPLLALLFACSSFFMRMDLPKLFLVLSGSFFLVLGPIAVSSVIHAGEPDYSLSYLAIVALPFALWALARSEPARRSAPATAHEVTETAMHEQSLMTPAFPARNAGA